MTVCKGSRENDANKTSRNVRQTRAETTPPAWIIVVTTNVFACQVRKNAETKEVDIMVLIRD